VEVIPQQAIKAILVLSTRKNSDASGGRSWDATFYYGVRSWDELEGSILHEMIPTVRGRVAVT
jgi:hypothetical protein